MIRTSKGLLAAGALFAAIGSAYAAPTYLNETFEMFQNANDNAPNNAPVGWSITNNSTAGGQSSWFKGDPQTFAAQSGSPNSYAAASYLAAPDNGSPNTISDWLFTPVLNFTNGTQVSFYTRTNGAVPGDSLEVRFSSNGGSTNVGTTTTSVGDFNVVLTTVTAAMYSTTWTQYTATISGLGAATDGRVAFRYFVLDNSAGGDYIGLDSVVIGAVPGAIPEPATPAVMALGFAALALVLRKRNGASPRA